MTFIKKFIRFILPVAVILGSLYGGKIILDRAPEAKRRKPPAAKLTVEVVPAVKRDYQVDLESRGTVRPRTQSTLIPEVSGRILHISPDFREGGFFEQGDVLLELDASDYETALVRAETSLAAATSTLDEGVIASKRREPEVTISESEVVQAKLALEEAKIDVKNKEAEVAFAKATVAKATAALASAASLPEMREASVRVSESALAQAKLVLHEEGARSHQAVEDWKKLGNGHSPSELVLRKPQLEAAKAAVASAGAQIEQKRIDLKLAPAEMAAAEAEVDAARARLDQREFDLKLSAITIKAAESAVVAAEAKLKQHKLDLTLTKPRLSAARAEVLSAEANVRQSQLALARTKITAPYAGRVLNRSVDVGQYVSPGSILATIYAVDYAEIRLPLTNQQLQFVDVPMLYRGESVEQLSDGPEVTLTAQSGAVVHEWKGRVVRAEGAIDTRSRQLFVIAQVENPYGRSVAGRPPLKVGLYVNATIAGRILKDVFVLPRTVLREGKQVLVVNDAKELTRRTVSVIWSDTNEIVVNEGLSDGERICISPVSFAGDKMNVELKGEPSKGTQSGGKP